jgi:hypothetical protein
MPTNQQNIATSLRREKWRKDRAGYSQNFPTHIFHGSGAIAVTPIDTTTLLNGLPSPIVAITKDNPAEVTSGNVHRFSTGDVVTIEDVGGMVEITDGQYTVTVVDANTYTLDGINSTAFTTYTSGGHARKQTRNQPIMFQTRIRILAGVSQGLIFEFGSSTRGAAAWVEPNMIGIVSGNGAVSNERASAVWDLGAALATDRIFQLTFAIMPGPGRVRLWDFGLRRADGVAVANDFGSGDWADTENGSFASAVVGTVMADVPAGSRIAPSNFEVIEPLKIFAGQIPRGFS